MHNITIQNHCNSSNTWIVSYNIRKSAALHDQQYEGIYDNRMRIKIQFPKLYGNIIFKQCSVLHNHVKRKDSVETSNLSINIIIIHFRTLWMSLINIYHIWKFTEEWKCVTFKPHRQSLMVTNFNTHLSPNQCAVLTRNACNDL